jgi:hypothetical protein
MSTHPSLNESVITDQESPIVSRQNGISRLTITAWICLLWVFVAFCIFWGTMDNTDVNGALKM